MDLATLQKLAVALGLGLLIGLERERVRTRLAGIRTFALISLLGFLCGISATALGPWPVVVGGLGMIAYMVVGYVMGIEGDSGEDIDRGLTTEVAALLVFVLGAYIVHGETGLAVVIGGAVVLLLHLKQQLHRFVERIGEKDVHAIMQFVLVLLVILPVLPNQSYGLDVGLDQPLGEFNPYVTWLMVVLIVGINLGGYVAYKLVGAQGGTLLAGFLGGLISSTATTLSFARQAAARAVQPRLAAVVILVATATAQVRVLGELAVVASRNWLYLAGPLTALLLAMAAAAGVLLVEARKDKAKLAEPANPAELTTAITFGLIYAAVTFAVSVVRQFFDDAGLYVVAFLSGLHDLDAITLSTGRMVTQGQMTTPLAWRVVMTACLANLIFKSGMVMALGPRALAKTVAVACGVLVAVGVVLMLVWP